MSSFTLLGTSSCEGIPAPFCRCKLCTFARKNGGRDRRRRFSMLIDDSILIDFGPDAAWQFEAFNVDETCLDAVCITHSHVDHLDTLDLIWGNSYADKPLKFIANEAAQKRVRDEFILHCGADNSGKFLDFVTPSPGREIAVGSAKVLPVRATHCDDKECALNYLVTSSDGKKIFVLSDTGWWRDESFEFVRNAGADAAVIEMSFGIHPPYDTEQRQHLGAAAAMDFLAGLKDIGALKKEAICVTAHISHCSNTTHSELEAFFADKGVIPGYDGLKIEL